MKFIIPTELDVRMATKFPLSFVDLGIVFLSFLLAFGLRVFVYTHFQIYFIIFVVATTIILVLDSPENKGKKIYDSIYLSFKRQENTFIRVYIDEK
ncbi:hypothetical protein KPL39_05975 [Clostridium gasigenes]|uniref:DUF5592 family protein n=1 Tax=Clostridium gasigenes TaxID=94869 RepID=UPI001C0DB5A9|nr:DUF5592 family protein [Clostridium gasigenes]MBU3135809.1 hypothetical protein [Clostridium gasigenes]